MANTITATLHGATKHGLSTNGNPTWILHTDAGDLRTSSDAGIGYEISNHTGRPEHSRHSWVGREVTFKTTKAGRVWDWELAR